MWKLASSSTRRPAQALEQCSRLLPTRFGIGQAPWAELWLKARAAAGLSAPRQGTLLPAAAETGWHEVPVRTTEFASQLRALLLELRFSVGDLDRIGAHSLKVTCLTWAAKFGGGARAAAAAGVPPCPG